MDRNDSHNGSDSDSYNGDGNDSLQGHYVITSFVRAQKQYYEKKTNNNSKLKIFEYITQQHECTVRM